jgi:5-methyltetrahydrofolate--homocysteine methyltransferase
MVPADKILEAAKKENVDVIGLSGLITPSLDEMVHVAKEMERLQFSIPLLIGGATTSKVHTAVKIAPNYKHPVVHVNDASRSVPVVSNLISKENKASFVSKLNEEYERVRELQKNANHQNKLISLSEARKNKFKIDWKNYHFHKPKKLGVNVVESLNLNELIPLIDWTPFFHSWELKGSYPKIFDDPSKGEEAKKLFNDAQKMLQQIIDQNWLIAKGVCGIFCANSIEDDIEIYSDESRKDCIAKLHGIRQQTLKPVGQANICLSDFLAPKVEGPDYIGMFAVTTGIGIEKQVEKFEKDHDDYSAIMLKALADRLAEAFAEYLHLKVRKEFWGYATNENLSNEDLIREEYAGIRPAPGYPAQPDHTEKPTIFNLLQVEKNCNITLTESMAMWPTAAVSGLYFSHADSHYFGVGKIGKDQVEDYAKRKGLSLDETERWLSPILSY